MANKIDQVTSQLGRLTDQIIKMKAALMELQSGAVNGVDLGKGLIIDPVALEASLNKVVNL